jgi:hypothetical protein
VPDAAEVVPLVLELLYLDHLREAFDALHEWVLDRRSHAARERHELRRVELLVAEKDDLMLEERPPNFRLGKVLRELDAENLGAECPRESANFYCSTLMFWLLMIEP